MHGNGRSCSRVPVGLAFRMASRNKREGYFFMKHMGKYFRHPKQPNVLRILAYYAGVKPASMVISVGRTSRRLYVNNDFGFRS